MRTSRAGDEKSPNPKNILTEPTERTTKPSNARLPARALMSCAFGLNAIFCFARLLSIRVRRQSTLEYWSPVAIENTANSI